MSRQFDRRMMLGASAAALGSLATGAVARPSSSDDADEKPIRKAVKIGMVQESISLKEKFQLLKDLGFDGVELDSPNDLETSEVLAARDETGLPIHGVVDSVHWTKTLSDPNPVVRDEGRAGLETALRDAKAYGASTVLLVPAVVNKQVSYADAYHRSRTEIHKVLPLAGELGVRIALENVWNNFLLSPLEVARYIDDFYSPWIGAYFDVGNVVRYGWPEHWIEVLGHRIFKLDIKEYSRKKQNDEGPWKGFGVELLEGDCDWPAVMRSLKKIGYRGWGTAEIPGGDRNRLRTIAELMDRIFAS
ncbi:MAG: sugar phosphate isomerase/epimerase family protein [Planctomycetota bacterium]